MKASVTKCICAAPPVNTMPEVSFSLSSSICAQTFLSISSYLASQISQRRLSVISLLCEIFMTLFWAQIEDDSEKLTSGIVFTGGAAQMHFVTEAFMNITNYNKQTRIAKGLPTDISTTTGVCIPDNGRANSILSMLMHGEQNCIIQKTYDTRTEHPANTPDTTPFVDGNTNIDNNTEVRDTTEQEEIPDNENKKKKKRSLWKMLTDALTDEE